MPEFLRSGDVIEPKLIFTLPEEKRPEMLMYHGLVYPLLDDKSHAVCLVHPNGEVRMFGSATPADVMSILEHWYGITFEQLQGISWD